MKIFFTRPNEIILFFFFLFVFRFISANVSRVYYMLNAKTFSTMTICLLDVTTTFAVIFSTCLAQHDRIRRARAHTHDNKARLGWRKKAIEIQ